LGSVRSDAIVVTRDVIVVTSYEEEVAINDVVAVTLILR